MGKFFTKSKFILISLVILAGYLPFFLNYNKSINYDWSYFNSFGLLLKSIILEYHRFPLHDPWVCGGRDLLSNPQNWVFSPLMILSLLFPAYEANLISIILMSFLGFIGMFKLLKHYNISDLVSLSCSLLFVNSSWLGLHITEGHLVFRSFFLLPMFMYFLLSLDNLKGFFLSTLLLGFFLLDGGIYSFIYALVIALLLFLLNMFPIKNFIYAIKDDPTTFGLILLAFLSLSATRIIPIVLMHFDRTPVLDQNIMSIKLIAQSLFYPFQTNMPEVGIRDYRFHEFGCYIGILSFLVICWGLRKKSFWKNNIKEISITLFFFCVATGIGGSINPWTIYLKIPLINNAHLQSRFFIIFLIFYLILLAKAFDIGMGSRFISTIILSVLILEFLLVKNYSSFKAFENHANVLNYPTYITKRELTKTLPYIPRPEVYFEANAASKWCGDNAVPLTDVLDVSDKEYRGEAYPLNGQGKIDLIEFSPGFIKARFELDMPGAIVFNTNSNGAWKAKYPDEIIENEKNLLIVSVNTKKGMLTLEYAPCYFKYIMILYITGITMYLVVCMIIFYDKQQAEKI